MIGVPLLDFILVAVHIFAFISLLVGYVVTDVPPMSATVAERTDVVTLLGQAGPFDGATIYDLGCGWGAQLISLSQAFPEAIIYGVEISLFPYLIALFRTSRLKNVLVRRENFYNLDLKNAGAITCYLMPSVMPQLEIFLDRTLRPGTPVVALTFWFRNRQISTSLHSAGRLRAAALYYWPAIK